MSFLFFIIENEAIWFAEGFFSGGVTPQLWNSGKNKVKFKFRYFCEMITISVKDLRSKIVYVMEFLRCKL
jgi:hypothetical protein